MSKMLQSHSHLHIPQRTWPKSCWTG